MHTPLNVAQEWKWETGLIVSHPNCCPHLFESSNLHDPYQLFLPSCFFFSSSGFVTNLLLKRDSVQVSCWFAYSVDEIFEVITAEMVLQVSKVGPGLTYHRIASWQRSRLQALFPSRCCAITSVSIRTKHTEPEGLLTHTGKRRELRQTVTHVHVPHNPSFHCRMLVLSQTERKQVSKQAQKSVTDFSLNL